MYSNDQLVTKWKDYDFAVRVHQGHEPEFKSQFNEYIKANLGETPTILYRKAKNYFYKSAKVGAYINQNSFITAASSLENTPDYKNAVFLELHILKEKSLKIDNEYVFPLGYRILIVTRKEENGTIHLSGKLVHESDGDRVKYSGIKLL